MDLVLYGAAGGCSRVTMTALEETGAPYNYEIVRFMKQEHISPAYRAKNPLGKIPCLVIDGRPLRENVAILWWLNETFPDAKLLPPVSDSVDRAEQIADLCFCSATLHPILTRVSVTMMFGSPEAVPSIREMAMTMMDRYFPIVEERLANRDYWYGDDWSVMDAYLAWFYHRMAAEGYDVKKYPRFTATMERYERRPAVQRVVEREAEEDAQMKREGLAFDEESFLSGSAE